MAYEIVKKVDAQGLQCPMPLLKAKQALNSVDIGSVIEVLATDAGSLKDFHAFAAATTHEILWAEEVQSVFYYHIKKGPLVVRQL